MIEFKNLCKQCMKKINDAKTCPYCGYNQDSPQLSPYLFKEALLENRYAIGKKTNESSIDIIYTAFDTVAKTPVLIQEFFPKPFCKRNDGQENVEILDEYKKSFLEHQEKFLKYFRALARFRELSVIVPVYNIFLQNNTAYVVYEFENTIPFVDFVNKHGGHLSWETARSLFMPLLSALSKMSSVSLMHLAICPQNLIISKDGKMKLIGFSMPEIRKQNILFAPTLYDGCAAIEQYIERAQISEATDVYGFAASLFYALTGKVPNNALKRQEDDRLMISKGIISNIPSYVVSAIANALQVLPNNRTTSFERLRSEISGCPTIIVKDEPQSKKLKDAELTPKEDKKDPSNLTLGILSCVIALIILITVGALWFFKNGLNLSDSSANSTVNSELLSSESAEALLNKVIVPDLKDKNVKDVQKVSSESEEYQILVSAEEFNDNVKQGCIISQSPTPGTNIEKGSSVVVLVSKGSKMRALPDISGLSLSEASLKITSSGLNPTQIYQNSDSVLEGNVIGYDNNTPGEQMEYGSTVKIIVSKGKN